MITKDRKSAQDDKKWWDLDKILNSNDEQPNFNLIHKSVGFVNDKIEPNYYFFVDILKEGIMLFNSGNCKLSELKNLNQAQRVKN